MRGERRRPGSDCLAARVTPEGRRLESEDLVGRAMLDGGRRLKLVEP